MKAFKTLSKIITLTLFFFSVVKISSAQAPVYNVCPSLINFNGEWKYENNGTIIKMYFRAHTFFSPNINLYEEELVGWHEYSVNGQIIESDYQHRFETIPTNFQDQTNIVKSIGLVFRLCKPVLTHLDGSLFDITRNMQQSISLVRLTNNTIKITQRPGGGSLTPVPIGYTLPQTFILTRQ